MNITLAVEFINREVARAVKNAQSVTLKTRTGMCVKGSDRN